MKQQYDIHTLHTREKFKELGFLRTKKKCCIPGCTCDADDAHHIMDRKLWSDSGYYLFNCAPVCYKHHIDCEKGVYTPLQLTKWIDVDPDEIRKPDKLDWLTEEEYKEMFKKEMIDKWGK